MAYAAFLLSMLGALFVFSFRSLVLRRGVSPYVRGEKTLEETVSQNLPGQRAILTPYRTVNRLLDRRYYPEQMYLVHDDGMINAGSPQLIEPQTAEDIRRLYELCQEQDKDFLYVLCPSKIMDDNELRQYGIPCHRNESADLFLQKLDSYGVPYLDLRPTIWEAGIEQGNPYALFYKTDHHWTADGGLIAARTIAGTLNDLYGLGLDTEAISEQNMSREILDRPFVGEMGNKLLGNLGQTDRLVVWHPQGEVHLHYVSPDFGIDRTGNFDIVFNEELLDRDPLPSSANLYYYFMKGNDQLGWIENADGNDSSILLVKDSYSCVVTPYLSLTAGKVTWWDMREDKALLSYLREHSEVKTVVVMYTVTFSINTEMNDFR